MAIESSTRAQERGNRIRQVALALFLRHGYQKVHMKDIAQACEISRPTLYSAFRSKEAVLDMIVREYGQETLRKTKERLAKIRGRHERLRAIFEIWVVGGRHLIEEAENARELARTARRVTKPADLAVWKLVEAEVLGVLRDKRETRPNKATRDLAHSLTLLAKATIDFQLDESELRVLLEGLIRMALANLAQIESGHSTNKHAGDR